MKPRDALKMTWGKRWAKEWAREHLENVSVTDTFVGTFGEVFMRAFERPALYPGWVIKPNNSTHSRGVVYIKETVSGVFLWSRKAHEARAFTKEALREELEDTLDKPIDAFQWLIEPLIEVDGTCVELFGQYSDGPTWVCDSLIIPPPVFRAVIYKGSFHFGEIHVPTRQSGGVGSLRKGAIRYVFDHTGTVRRPPKLAQAPEWIEACDGRADPELYDTWKVPGWSGVLEDINKRVVPTFGNRAMYAFDFLVAPPDGVPVFLEIEHSPNVKYLTQYNGFRP